MQIETCHSMKITHARARALPFFLPPAGWSMTKLLAAHVEGGRCFEILDREFLATHRDFALIRYTFSFVSIERAIKRVFLRRLRLMEDWLRSFFAIGRIYLMADWPVNVDRWRNDPEYRSGKKCRTCFKCKLISLNRKKEKKVFFLLLRTFILLDSFCSLIILISPFFDCKNSNLFNIRQIHIKWVLEFLCNYLIIFWKKFHSKDWFH